MPKRFYTIVPDRFSFLLTVRSHGWYDLPPFSFDESMSALRYVFPGTPAGPPVSVTVRGRDGRLQMETNDEHADTAAIKRGVRHIFRLDDDLDDFYSLTEDKPGFGWVKDLAAGRLLRSPTVWEDLVKTICTTNCTWGLTRKMVSNLVERLGETTAAGQKAFPTAQAMADAGVSFFRSEIKAGYRSAYFVELAEAVASGKLDPETWLDTDLPTDELQSEIKAVKGVGDYAAQNLLKLLGRYDGLALDSWLRAKFAEKHGSGRPCADKKIAKHYAQFGKWQGLAIWCDMTEYWHFAAEDKDI
jgi:N-glycosylase/DNA lyase